MSERRRIVVGITGASGALYARRLLQLLITHDCHVHLVISPMGQRLIHDELGPQGLDLPALTHSGSQDELAERLTIYNYRDVGAAIASGSFAHQGMVIVPCSSNSLSAVATGSSQNLIHRAAHVTLKERRRLILVHRETPLSLVDIRNMASVTEAGGILCPANPGFYMLPRTIDDLVDFVAGRIMDLLDVQHTLPIRWSEDVPGSPSSADTSCST